MTKLLVMLAIVAVWLLVLVNEYECLSTGHSFLQLTRARGICALHAEISQSGTTSFLDKEGYQEGYKQALSLAVTADDIASLSKSSSKGKGKSESALQKEAEKAARKEKKLLASIEKTKSARQLTGYNYADKYGEYDVPIVDEHLWYRMQVRKNSEKKSCEMLMMLEASGEKKWKGVVVNAFYQKAHFIRMAKDEVVLGTKAIIPGLIFVKTKMDPDIADDIEKLLGYAYFIKNNNNIVVPLNKDEGANADVVASLPEKVLPAEMSKLKKGEYVSIISGLYKGQYGIMNTVRNGRIEVVLRSEYKNDYYFFEPHEVAYLANPPEKKLSEMTPKETIESLMKKDQHSGTIKALRNAGILDAVLDPDSEYIQKRGDRNRQEREARQNAYGADRDTSRPRERSIAVDRNNRPSVSVTATRGDSDARSGSTSDDDEQKSDEAALDDLFAKLGSSSSTRSQEPKTWEPSRASPSTSSTSTSYIVSSGSSSSSSASSSTLSEKYGSEKPWRKVSPSESYTSSPQQAARNSYSSSQQAGGGNSGAKKYNDDDDDLDSFIQGLIGMDAPDSAQGGKRGAKEEDGFAGRGGDVDWLSEEKIDFDSPLSSKSNSAADSSNMDSEQLLDQLLREMSQDKKAASKAPTKSSSFTTAPPSPPQNEKKTSSGPAPNMKDYGDFTEYLDALMVHMSSGGGGGGAAASPPKKGSSKAAPATASMGNKKLSGEADTGSNDFDAELYNLLNDDSQSPKEATRVKEVAVPLRKSPSEVEKEVDELLRSTRESFDNKQVKQSSSSAASASISKSTEGSVTTTTKKAVSSSTPLNSLSVVELKEKLRANGLKVSGTKSELISRLEAL